MGGITFEISSLEEDMSAIFKRYSEHMSVEIIAGPPAFDTIATPESLSGTNCFENAVANSNKSLHRIHTNNS